MFTNISLKQKKTNIAKNTLTQKLLIFMVFSKEMPLYAFLLRLTQSHALPRDYVYMFMVTFIINIIRLDCRNCQDGDV